MLYNPNMKKLKLYIETSGWNFYYADDAPEKRDITREFFELLDKGVYDIYISKIVFDEIKRCPEPRRTLLLDLIEKYTPKEIPVSKEAEELSQYYLNKGLVPLKKVEDALHVAISSVAEMDALISWNYKHMANIRKSERFYGANLEQGYAKLLQIVTPTGVMSDEN